MKNKEQLKILFGQILVHLSIVPMIIYGSPWQWSLTIMLYFFQVGWGISLCNHRYLSHKTFVLKSKLLKTFLLFCSTVSLQGSALAWVAMHREHHAHSDDIGDPHRPKDGFFHSYFLSMMHTPNIRYIKDHLRDTDVTWFHKHYWKINLTYSVLLFAIFGPMGPVVGHLIPAFFTWQAVGMVNAVAHVDIKMPWILGYKSYETGDDSKNLPLIGVLAFGEGWHNNHHQDPRNPSFTRLWYEWDLMAQILSCLVKLQLAEYTV